MDGVMKASEFLVEVASATVLPRESEAEVSHSGPHAGRVLRWARVDEIGGTMYWVDVWGEQSVLRLSLRESIECSPVGLLVEAFGVVRSARSEVRRRGQKAQRRYELSGPGVDAELRVLWEIVRSQIAARQDEALVEAALVRVVAEVPEKDAELLRAYSE